MNKRARERANGSLLDRGANGGVAGDDVMVVYVDENQRLDISGLGNHKMADIPVGTHAATG